MTNYLKPNDPRPVKTCDSFNNPVQNNERDNSYSFSPKTQAAALLNEQLSNSLSKIFCPSENVEIMIWISTRPAKYNSQHGGMSIHV